jgi:hypothetical protein
MSVRIDGVYFNIYTQYTSLFIKPYPYAMFWCITVMKFVLMIYGDRGHCQTLHLSSASSDKPASGTPVLPEHVGSPDGDGISKFIPMYIG